MLARSVSLIEQWLYLEAAGGFEAVRGRMIRDAVQRNNFAELTAWRRAGREKAAPGYMRGLGNAADQWMTSRLGKTDQGEKMGEPGSQMGENAHKFSNPSVSAKNDDFFSATTAMSRTVSALAGSRRT
jgi:hypothetical protein